MKLLAYLVLSILAIGTIVYCVYRYRGALGSGGSSGHQETPSPDNSSRQTTNISWQTFDRTTPDRFKIDMPVGASEIQVPAYTGAGSQEPGSTCSSRHFPPPARAAMTT